ncbi:chaperone modulator CbpM [Gloeothece verrucosa]|uniref:Uncharacterized protein n=1 Tax=Gloeothece verrucosa (strain PCC 7822) TaxID=497965 RepID=E0UG65_GLOV7|nr:chaperone modulator CbpM [Gloeothece verrucosa]ADN15566.1 conserved hypothetical protein [Gloeothece verrucosa PCC 7822]
MSEADIDLSQLEVQESEERFYTYEEAAGMVAISVNLIQRLVILNVVESDNAQLRAREIARIAQILRLRRDLGVNWVGAGMMLDMAQEIARLKARLRLYHSPED